MDWANRTLIGSVGYWSGESGESAIGLLTPVRSRDSGESVLGMRISQSALGCRCRYPIRRERVIQLASCMLRMELLAFSDMPIGLVKGI